MNKRKTKPKNWWEDDAFQSQGFNTQNMAEGIDNFVEGIDKTVEDFQKSWKSMKSSKLGRYIGKKLEIKEIKKRKLACFLDNIRCKQLEKQDRDYFGTPTRPI